MKTNLDIAPEPENIRLGAPYDNPAFESLCREHGIWGTASAALCAVFWRSASIEIAALRQAWQMALDALDVSTTPFAKDRQSVLRAIEALRAALEQREVGQEPAGFKLTPLKPTPEMVDAGVDAAREYFEIMGGNSPTVIYRAMLSAAPQPIAQAQPLTDKQAHGIGGVKP